MGSLGQIEYLLKELVMASHHSLLTGSHIMYYPLVNDATGLIWA